MSEQSNNILIFSCIKYSDLVRRLPSHSPDLLWAVRLQGYQDTGSDQRSSAISRTARTEACRLISAGRSKRARRAARHTRRASYVGWAESRGASSPEGFRPLHLIRRPRVDLAPEVQLQPQDEPFRFVNLVNKSKIAEPDPKAVCMALAPLDVKIRFIEMIAGDMTLPW